MKNKLSDSDLTAFQLAILKDYGIRLEGKELYEAAFDLIHFFEELIKFDKENQALSLKRFESHPKESIENHEEEKDNE